MLQVFTMNKTKLNSERLNKIILWKYKKKKKIVQSPGQKNTTELFKLMPQRIFILSLKHVSVVYDGVFFY